MHIDIAVALNRAHALAAKNVPVFPCIETKAPACQQGFKDASTDRAQIDELWRRYPGPLIGTPTGVMFDVLDIDTAKHLGALDWWTEKRHWLPETRMHRTRSGGLHLLFKADPSRRCSASKIAPGIDVRACGGYIIWWPAAGLPVLSYAPLASWPEWLVPPKPAAPCERARPIPTSDGLTKYAEAAIDAACRNIIAAPNGQQEITLVREAFSIGTLAGAGGAPTGFARDALHWAAHKVPSYDARRPWCLDQLVAKIDRAFDAGLNHPREARHD